MSYSLKMKPKKALIRQKIDITLLRKQFGRAYRIGGVDDFGLFKGEPDAPEAGAAQTLMVYAARERLGRGFYITIAPDGTCEVRTPMPTTNHDLEDMFTFVGVLAKMLGSAEMETTGGHIVPFASLMALFTELKKENADLLKSRIIASDEAPIISTVKIPLQMPENLRGRISMMPAENGVTYFSAYLAEKQQMEFTYMRPWLQPDEGPCTAVYTVAEDTPTVLQIAPFIPPGPSPFEGKTVENWVVRLVPRNLDVLGSLPYADFVHYLEENELLRPYDEQHRIIYGLGLKRMKDMLG